MSNFETLVIAALTSAAVALAVEWAAKPRLEARKDRIIEQSKAKREIEFQLGRIAGLSGSLIFDISTPDLDNSDQEVVIDVLEGRRDEIIAASKAVRCALDVTGLKIDRSVKDVIYKAMNWIEIYASACDVGTEDMGLALAIVGGRALDMCQTHWWQGQKRRKLVAVGTSLSDAMDSPSS